MEYQIEYEKAIANRGNLFRLKETMKRAKQGEKLVIGFLGGSITQGSLATSPELCYAYRVFSWWQKKFPKAQFAYQNAGIGGTTSQFGAARVEDDLLSAEPDIVFVEFSVNDDSNDHFMETYEGLVRRIYIAKSEPAMILIHNMRYDDGASAQRIHGRVGRYYDLPSISMQSSIYPQILQGNIANREITEDDLHPNDQGHALVASVITYFLDQIYSEINQSEAVAQELKKPFTANGYEDSIRYHNKNSDPVLEGFIIDRSIQNDITDCFKNGWRAFKVGASIVFEVYGSCIAVQYRKTRNKPAPIAEVTIDGKKEQPYILDANFDETWGDKLELETIAEHIEMKKHLVEIRICKASENNKVPFELISVIASGIENK